jgi:hypothetical protein
LSINFSLSISLSISLPLLCLGAFKAKALNDVDADHHVFHCLTALLSQERREVFSSSPKREERFLALFSQERREVFSCVLYF